MQKNLRNNEGQTGEKKREGEYCDEKEGGEGGESVVSVRW